MPKFENEPKWVTSLLNFSAFLIYLGDLTVEKPILIKLNPIRTLYLEIGLLKK
jgi:hypothetical protein